MSEQLHFRISAALKDIIGRDLITDDYIAVFELVKNSYDAYANKVDIFFNNIYSKTPSIIIMDTGKGMDKRDLKNKWLFVAYSAKKEGTEDDTFDYRDNIYQNRPFAGAKGIGRFSCDRLGKKLYLESKKKSKNSKVEVLLTDWEKFETSLKKEFVEISVTHKALKEGKYKLSHGTVLEITELRSEWNREKLLKLKDSLAKLINPTSSKKQNSFEIVLHAPDEFENDASEDDYKDKVNGEIKNFIFEDLELKTTKIEANISHNKKYFTTTLYDGGTLIYKIKEPNQFNLLSDISFTLYYLNRSAKMTFAKKMGLASRKYGHVFLYKNGFRIYPFGEPNEDPLRVDVRKSRKKFSTLGTGEIMGQIEVFGNNPELKETSSRGDGLVHNKHYDDLTKCFFVVLERLEKYVVDVQQWGLSIEDENIDASLKTRIATLIETLTGSSNILEFEYADNFLQILEEGQSDSTQNIIKNLRRIGLNTKNDQLLKETKKLASRLTFIQKAKQEADAEAKRAGKELEEVITENLFLRSVKGQEFDEIISFLHHIGISASIADNYLVGLYKLVEEDFRNLSNKQVNDILRLVIFENKKIINVAKFATKANFKLSTGTIEHNLDEYIKEYVTNIISLTTSKKLEIKFENFNSKPLVKKFRPIEVNILIDNLLSNSKKAGATVFSVKITRSNDNDYQLIFEDNGMGISKENLENIYTFGYTTTAGSGIGLYHVKEIVKRLNGKISVKSSANKGTTFIITLK